LTSVEEKPNHIKSKADSDNTWYAIYVCSRHEKTVYQSLIEKDVECSLPLIKKFRRWSDRKKRIEVPLFRGYVFVRINLGKDKFTVLETDSVVKYIGIRGVPSPIRDEQMYWLNTMANQFDTVQHETEIPIGEKVKVVTGPCKGMEGVVVTRKNQERLVVMIEAIMQAVSIEIHPEYLERVRS